jgi:transporter family-2 protein
MQTDVVEQLAYLAKFGIDELIEFPGGANFVSGAGSMVVPERIGIEPSPHRPLAMGDDGGAQVGDQREVHTRWAAKAAPVELALPSLSLGFIPLVLAAWQIWLKGFVRMRYLILILVILGGAVIPMQVAANKRMEDAVRSPVLAATLAMLGGGLALAVISTTGWLGRGHLLQAAHAPWWVWLISCLAIFTVVSIIAIPRVGAAAVIAATVFGELSAAAILDHFGWLGVPQIRINGWRIAGAILLFAGMLLMQRKS